MLFCRSVTSRPGPAIGPVRTLVATSLFCYPAGCALLALRHEAQASAPALTVAGLGLILLSIVAAAPVIGSRFQRIVADQASVLDEFELKLRQRALGAAYQVFSALALLAIVYLAIAADTGWWAPKSYEQFNALFWGVFLLACLLPTALLVWSTDGRLVDAGEEDAL